MPETLYEETLRLVRESDLSVPEIQAGTGLGRRWLYHLLDGGFADPGVNKIERLSAFIRRQSGKAA